MQFKIAVPKQAKNTGSLDDHVRNIAKASGIVVVKHEKDCHLRGSSEEAARLSMQQMTTRLTAQEPTDTPLEQQLTQEERTVSEDHLLTKNQHDQGIALMGHESGYLGNSAQGGCGCGSETHGGSADANTSYTANLEDQSKPPDMASQQYLTGSSSDNAGTGDSDNLYLTGGATMERDARGMETARSVGTEYELAGTGKRDRSVYKP